jgi:hypothetical protein
MKPYFFHPDALIEFKEAVLYYESKQEGLGWRFRQSVLTTLNEVCQNPELFRFVFRGEPLRQARVKRFPYAVMFWEHLERMEVISGRNFHRKPGFWASRLRTGPP